MGHPGAADRITAAVMSWDGVSSQPHRFGGIEFRLGRRELGHLHGDALADLPFPRRVHDELIAAGRARIHHAVPDSGWVTRPLRGDADVEDAIALFRLAYDRARTAARRRVGSDGDGRVAGSASDPATGAAGVL
jgi:luciferase-like monooxygenase